MRVWVACLVIGVGFAGCLQADPGVLEDRGELPEDIAAPSPRAPPGEPLEFVDPPGDQGNLAGAVRDASGRPVAGVTVWVEAVDLRDPVDNVAIYEQVRNATRTVTDTQGRFTFSVQGGLYSVATDAPGWLPSRSEAIELRAEPLDIDMVIVPDGVQIIAHRGASFYAPENTLPAIQKARWLGAHAVELDVRLTRDGRTVVFHDPALERTTDGGGLVDRVTFSFMATLDAGAWFDGSFRGTPVPTLRQALAAADGLGIDVMLDVKAAPERAAATRAAVVADVRASGMEEQVVVAAFRKATVTHCVEHGLRCAYINNGTLDGPASLDTAQALGASMLLLNQSAVEPGLAAEAAQRGMRLYAWTANEVPEWSVLLDHGVHGIITDRPAYLAQFLADQP